MPILSVHKLSIWKRGNKKKKLMPIVSNVSFDINKGDVLGILGPNGAGKSSILWALTGLIPCSKIINSSLNIFSPTWGDETRIMEGTFKMENVDITHLPSGERNMGLVPQNLFLYPSMTVFNNIAFSLKNNKEESVDAKVRRIATSFGISDILNKRPSEISGGQQQRVAVARAIVKKPTLALFDEALSSADPLSKSEFIPYIRNYLREYNGSAIYVTHDPEEASLFCDKVIIIKDGIVLQEGSAKELFQKPCDMFVASFFSGVNSVLFGDFSSESHQFVINNTLSIDFREFHETINPFGKIIKAIGFRPRGLSFIDSSKSNLVGTIIDKPFINKVQCVRIKLDEIGSDIIATETTKLNSGEKVGIIPNLNHKEDIFFFNEKGELLA